MSEPKYHVVNVSECFDTKQEALDEISEQIRVGHDLEDIALIYGELLPVKRSVVVEETP